MVRPQGPGRVGMDFRWARDRASPNRPNGIRAPDYRGTDEAPRHTARHRRHGPVRDDAALVRAALGRHRRGDPRCACPATDHPRPRARRDPRRHHRGTTRGRLAVGGAGRRRPGRLLQLRPAREPRRLPSQQRRARRRELAAPRARRPRAAPPEGGPRRGLRRAGPLARAARGAAPAGRPGRAPYDFTWSFVLRRHPHRATRLITRERFAYTHPWSPLLVEPVSAASSLMCQKMLRGIRDRVERARRDWRRAPVLLAGDAAGLGLSPWRSRVPRRA